MTTDKQVLHDKINTFFEESYFDVHSIGTKLSFTETQLQVG